MHFLSKCDKLYAIRYYVDSNKMILLSMMFYKNITAERILCLKTTNKTYYW